MSGPGDYSVTIASGQTKSSAFSLHGAVLFGLRIPAAITGTSISLEESDKIDGTFRPVYDSTGTLVSVPVSASRTCVFPPAAVHGLKFIKLVSSASEGTDRAIGVISRDYAR